MQLVALVPQMLFHSFISLNPSDCTRCTLFLLFFLYMVLLALLWHSASHVQLILSSNVESIFHHSHYMSKSLSDCISYFCISCSIRLNVVRALLLFGGFGLTCCSRHRPYLLRFFVIFHNSSRHILRWYLKIGHCFISYHS